MKSYFIPELNQTVYVLIHFNHYPEVVFADSDDGTVIFTASLPLFSGRKSCCFIKTPEYPWLYKFLVDNAIGMPTYRCYIKDNKVYEEFQFLKEKK